MWSRKCYSLTPAAAATTVRGRIIQSWTWTSTTLSSATATVANTNPKGNLFVSPWGIPRPFMTTVSLARAYSTQNNINNHNSHLSEAFSWLPGRDELLEIREEFRAYDASSQQQDVENTVTLQKASALSSSSSLLSQLGDTTLVLEMKNVASRNALTGKMMAELADAVDWLEDHTCNKNNNNNNNNNLTALIIRGHGGFFCAGADLGVAAQHMASPEAGRRMSCLMTDTTTRLRSRIPLVTVSALEGVAMGGGAELCTATDYRMASHTARVCFVHTRMGVSPGWGGATRLVKCIGRQRALQALGTAQVLDAPQALKWGLVDQIVYPHKHRDDDDDDEDDEDDDNSTTKEMRLMEQALVQFLNPFVHADPTVLHAAKRVVAGADDAPSFDEAARHEHQIFCSMWGGQANQAALARRTQDKKSK